LDHHFLLKEEREKGKWVAVSIDYQTANLSPGTAFLDEVSVRYELEMEITCQCECPKIIGSETRDQTESATRRVDKKIRVQDEIVADPLSLPTGPPSGTVGDIIATFLPGFLLPNRPILTPQQSQMISNAIDANLPKSKSDGNYIKPPCQNR
jgi:hypothetical protein